MDSTCKKSQPLTGEVLVELLAVAVERLVLDGEVLVELLAVAVVRVVVVLVLVELLGA